MKTEYHLYSTLGCHLCEEAVDMIGQLGYKNHVEVVEIHDSPEWVERYGVRIPVIRHLATEKELGWPFSLEQLQDFLAANQD